jgi:hypothetical protein
MTSHIVLYSLIGLAGLILAFVRFLRNRHSGTTLKRTLNYLDANPMNSWKLAEKLDCFIGRTDEQPDLIRATIQQLRTYPRVGKYEIHRIIEVQKDYYLFVTTCTDQDFGLGVGGLGTIKEVFQTNFALRIGKVSGQREMYAHQYTNREEERLLKEFAKGFFNVARNVSYER